MGRKPKVMSDGWREFLDFAGFDFLCEVNHGGRYLEISPKDAEAFGLAPVLLKGRTPFELGLIHPEDGADQAGCARVLSSGYNEPESAQEFIGKGLAGFIQKPYQLSELRKVVANTLNRN